MVTEKHMDVLQTRGIVKGSTKKHKPNVDRMVSVIWPNYEIYIEESLMKREIHIIKVGGSPKTLNILICLLSLIWWLLKIWRLSCKPILYCLYTTDHYSAKKGFTITLLPLCSTHRTILRNIADIHCLKVQYCKQYKIIQNEKQFMLWYCSITDCHLPQKE